MSVGGFATIVDGFFMKKNYFNEQSKAIMALTSVWLPYCL